MRSITVYDVTQKVVTLIFHLLHNWFSSFGLTPVAFSCLPGTDINVPPVATDEQNYAANIRPLAPGEEDDGQYREDPDVYWKDARYNQPAAAPVQKQAPRPQYYQQPAAAPAAPQYQEEEYEQPQYVQPAAPQHRFQYQQPRAYYQAPVQQPRYHQAQHQAQQPQPGYDINTGSYSISYTG